jgi:hypothetical protein
MHLHPDPALPLAQLERAGAPGKGEMPVMATRASGQFALAANDKTTPTALGESIIGRDVQLEFNHASVDPR